jgi:hypothetical protein
MLIQIGENSATLTPFGSLARPDHNADDHGIPNARAVRLRVGAIKVALRWIFNFFPAVLAASLFGYGASR